MRPHVEADVKKWEPYVDAWYRVLKREFDSKKEHAINLAIDAYDGTVRTVEARTTSWARQLFSMGLELAAAKDFDALVSTCRGLKARRKDGGAIDRAAEGAEREYESLNGGEEEGGR